MSAGSIAIIDGGGANLASLTIALDRLGASYAVTADADTVRGADRVILPGVGAAADAMSRLSRSGLDTVIPDLEQPVLGICLGMQLLATASDEDQAACLDIVSGTARKLEPGPNLPVPNMGWCQLRHDGSHALLAGIPADTYFYFVHSYALDVADYTIGTAEHGAPFTAVLASGNFHATQFHPEKSSAAGSRLLANFLAL